MPLCLPISPLITWRQCTLEGAGGGGCSLQPCLPTILVFPAGRDLARSARPCSCPGPDSLHAEKESWQSQKNRSPSTFCDKNINQHLFKSQQIFSEHFPCARHRADYIGLRASVSKVHNQGLKEQGPRKAVCASELRIEMLAISLPQPYSTVGTSPPQSTRSSCLLSWLEWTRKSFLVKHQTAPTRRFHGVWPPVGYSKKNPELSVQSEAWVTV